MIEHAYNHSPGSRFLMKCDDDTFVNTPLLGKKNHPNLLIKEISIQVGIKLIFLILSKDFYTKSNANLLYKSFFCYCRHLKLFSLCISCQFIFYSIHSKVHHSLSPKSLLSGYLTDTSCLSTDQIFDLQLKKLSRALTLSQESTGASSTDVLPSKKRLTDEA